MVTLREDAWAKACAGLTTVAQPLAGSGMRGAELLLAALDGTDVPEPKQHLPLELVVRGTTRSPGEPPDTGQDGMMRASLH